MKIDWSKDEGWRIYEDSLLGSFVIVPALHILGDASRLEFVQTESRAYIEVAGVLAVNESGAVISPARSEYELVVPV